MDGGTITGIVVGVVLGVVLVYALGVYTARQPTVTPFKVNLVFLKVLYYFMPYCLAFYTMFNDVIFETVMYVPALGLAIGSIILNWYFSDRVGKPPLSGLCTVPGLSYLPAYEVPQSMLFTTVILSYIGGFNTTIQVTKGSDWTKIISPWVFLASLLLIQFFMMRNDGCFDSFNITLGGVGNMFFLLLAAAASAGIGYALTTQTPFAEASSGSPSFTSAGPTTKAPMAKSSDPNVGTCSAPNDQDQFVCEAYKNGELITSTITEGFIGK